MRQSSALLERLDKRFQSIDDRADRRSVGMRERDGFLSQFADRMTRLENLVEVPEMSAFRRLPRRRSAFDPWGSMGNWSALSDLTYLQWMAEQEEEMVEEEKPRVSAWGKPLNEAAVNRERSSAWLNTPYTPARVAGKPAPKPQQPRRSNRPISSVSKSRPARTSNRTKTAVAPSLSPLKRALGRATVAQEHRRVERQVVSSLPPMLAKTTGTRFAQKQNEPSSTRRNMPVSLKTPSPMMRMVAQEIQSNLRDSDVPALSVAQGRTVNSGSTTRPTLTTASLNQYDSQVPVRRTSRNRGLRTQTSQLNLIQDMSSVDTASLQRSSKRVSSNMDVELKSVIETNVVRQVQQALPKKVAQVLSGESSDVRSVVNQLSPSVSKVVITQVEKVFKDAQIDDLMGVIRSEPRSRQSKNAAVRQVEQIVQQVVDVVLAQNESTIQQVGTADSSDISIQQPTTAQSRMVVRRLQQKGISKSLAEKAVAVLPTSTMDATQVDNFVDVVYEDLLATIPSGGEEGQRSTVTGSQLSSKVESVVRAMVSKQSSTGLVGQLMSRADGGVVSPRNSSLTSGSLLPNVVGENFTDRIVADLVQEISQFAERELTLESSAGQQQLMDTVEQSIKRLSSRQRAMRVGSLDWVDVQANTSDMNIEEQEGSEGSKSASPWFTRAVDPTESSTKLQPMQQAASRMLQVISANPTRPEVVAKQTGLTVREVTRVLEQIQGVADVSNRGIGNQVQNTQRATGLSRAKTGIEQKMDVVGQPFDLAHSESQKHSLEHLWDRATAPVDLPQWRGTGTSSFKPYWGESAKAWRLDPKRKPVHPFAVRSPVEETLLTPDAVSNADLDIDGVKSESANASSPWLSHKDTPSTETTQKYVTGLGFVPETISGDAKLSSSEIAQFGASQAVQLSVADVKGRKAQWLQPNRTVVLDNGTVIHAKVAQRLGIQPTRQAGTGNLPLSWTLEGVQLQSDHKSLPSWAKRASGKPQVSASPEFLMALAKSNTAEDVAQVILSNMGAGTEAILPKTAMTVIDQIRREAHRGLESLSEQVAAQEESIVRSRGPRDRSRRRVSRTARAVMDGFTGLKPISTATPTETSTAQGVDKVSKLAKQLESLVSLAESNRRDEAREGVRMAEDSHDAVAEGQAVGGAEERDYEIDIAALRQEVLSAFEQEMSLRSLRSFNNNDNTDPWW